MHSWNPSPWEPEVWGLIWATQWVQSQSTHSRALCQKNKKVKFKNSNKKELDKLFLRLHPTKPFQEPGDRSCRAVLQIQLQVLRMRTLFSQHHAWIWGPGLIRDLPRLEEGRAAWDLVGHLLHPLTLSLGTFKDGLYLLFSYWAAMKTECPPQSSQREFCTYGWQLLC